MSKRRSDIDHVAMAIVNHVCETLWIRVEERQKHNDELMDYAYGKIIVLVSEYFKKLEDVKAEVKVQFDGPYNEAKDDAQAYCGDCGEDLSDGDDDWRFCPRCGVGLLWPGEYDERD